VHSDSQSCSSTAPVVQQNTLDVKQGHEESKHAGEGIGEKHTAGDLAPAGIAVGGPTKGGGKPKLEKFAYSCESFVDR